MPSFLGGFLGTFENFLARSILRNQYLGSGRPSAPATHETAEKLELAPYHRAIRRRPSCYKWDFQFKVKSPVGRPSQWSGTDGARCRHGCLESGDGRGSWGKTWGPFLFSSPPTSCSTKKFHVLFRLSSLPQPAAPGPPCFRLRPCPAGAHSLMRHQFDE